MITKVSAKALKGLDFETQLGRLNLLVGPNGAGKSARADVIMLTLLGYLPGGSKRPGDILSSLGSDEKMFVGVELSDRTHLLRRYAMENGSVSQGLMVNRKKASKEAFAVAASGVKVLDLQAFHSLSDQKKIDLVFGLFPPAGDVAELDGKIEDAKTKHNRLQADIRALEQTISRLTSGRAEIQLPGGTLADVSAEIRETELRLSATQKTLEQVRIDAAATLAADKATKEAEAKAAEDLPKIQEQAKSQAESDFWQRRQEETQRVSEEAKSIQTHQQDPAESIQTILDTMGKAGCTACAAGMVAKRELRKYRKTEGRAA